MLIGDAVAVVARRRVAEQGAIGRLGAIGRRVTTSSSSLGASPHLEERTEQRQELTAKPAPEEVVRDDVDG